MKLILPGSVPLQHLSLPEIGKDLLTGKPLEVTPEEHALVIPRLSSLFVRVDDVNGAELKKIVSSPLPGDSSLAELVQVEA